MTHVMLTHYILLSHSSGFSQFGFYDDNETVVEMLDQDVSTKITPQTHSGSLCFISICCSLFHTHKTPKTLKWWIKQTKNVSCVMKRFAYFLPVSVVLKRCVWTEDAGGSWGSDHLLCSRRGTRVLALEWDGVPHVYREVAGVKHKSFYGTHTVTLIHTSKPCLTKCKVFL